MNAQPRYPTARLNILGIPANEIRVAIAGVDALLLAGVSEGEATEFMNAATRSDCDHALTVALEWMTVVCTKAKPRRVS